MTVHRTIWRAQSARSVTRRAQPHPAVEARPRRHAGSCLQGRRSRRRGAPRTGTHPQPVNHLGLVRRQPQSQLGEDGCRPAAQFLGVLAVSGDHRRDEVVALCRPPDYADVEDIGAGHGAVGPGDVGIIPVLRGRPGAGLTTSTGRALVGFRQPASVLLLEGRRSGAGRSGCAESTVERSRAPCGARSGIPPPPAPGRSSLTVPGLCRPDWPARPG